MRVGAETLLDLSLARGTLRRDLDERRNPDIWPTVLGEPGTLVLELADLAAPVYRVDHGVALATRNPLPADRHSSGLYLGRDPNGVAHVAVIRREDDDPTRLGAAPQELSWRSLREVGADLADTDAAVFTSALALAQWHQRHPKCPRCGAETTIEEGGWMRRCVVDGSEHYPRTDAAVIVAVTDQDDRLLLAQGTGWADRRRSLLAGFVEAGETLEAAARREVAEEVGITIGSLQYRGNQPWPFPASLMVGFDAVAESTELQLDPAEIVGAGWYSRAELGAAIADGSLVPPAKVSIARQLIEDWFEGQLPAADEPWQASTPKGSTPS